MFCRKIACITLLLTHLTIFAADEAPHVFPKAQGFGIDTLAGRGGRIVKVSNLNPSGAGSLRDALEQNGPRIIVFEVAGVIDLQMQKLQLKSPFVTVAGQTAPTPGITVIRGGLSIATHDVLLQHLRFRMGDAGLSTPRKGYEPGVSVFGANAYNVVIDHCSFSWAVDQNLSVSGKAQSGQTAHRITFSNNIIAEALQRSIHTKGSHSMGSLIHDHAHEVALIGNLFIHNEEANPWFKGFSSGAIINNVIYNPGKTAIRLGPTQDEWHDAETHPALPQVSIVGNVLRHGPDTKPNLRMVESNSAGEAFLQDNLAENRNGAILPVAANRIIMLPNAPEWPELLRVLPAERVWSQVLRNAGARPKDRDPVDRRLLLEARKGEGKIINSQEDVGGYPKVTPTFRPLNIPTQDVDAWLLTFNNALE